MLIIIRRTMSHLVHWILNAIQIKHPPKWKSHCEKKIKLTCCPRWSANAFWIFTTCIIKTSIVLITRNKTFIKKLLSFWSLRIKYDLKKTSIVLITRNKTWFKKDSIVLVTRNKTWFKKNFYRSGHS